MNHKINICYICNDNYASQTGISILSLIANKSKCDDIHIFLIDVGISDINLDILKEICKRAHIELIIYRPQNLIHKINTSLAFIQNDKNYAATVIRLFLGEILPPDIDRILYLDSDTIINHSLYNLYSTEFQEPIAAVVDANFDFNFTERHGFEKAHYFNAGILLIHLNEFRKITKESQIMFFLSDNPIFKDQDVLNVILKNNFYKLSPTYNASIRYRLLNPHQLNKWMKWNQPPYNDKQLDEAKLNPSIIHYTWSPLGRPWEVHNLDPDRNVWNHYYKISPWAKVPLSTPKVSMKKSFIRNIFKHCPIDIYMTIEYIYFKKDLMKAVKARHETNRKNH